MLLMTLGKGRGREIVIKVVVEMAAVDGNAAAVCLADVENVVPSGAVLYDSAVATQPACAVAVFLKDRVVEDVHVARHPLLAARVAHLDEWSVGHVPTAAWGTVGAPRDVLPDVERPDGDRCVGNGYEHVLHVVVPYPHVLIATLGLDTIVPAVGDVIAVDVAIGAGETPVAAVVSGAHPVVEVMILVRPALVVPDDVVARGLPEDHRLRPLGVGGFAVFLRPAVGVPRGVVHPAALDNDGAEVPAVAEDAGLVVLAPALLALAAPLADIAVLDDDVMAAEEPDPMFFHIPYCKAAEDDVARAHGDTDIVLITGVDGAARPVVQHVGIWPPRSVHGERGVAIGNLHYGVHRELFAPGCPPAFDSPAGPLEGQGNVVGRSRRQVHKTAAVIGLAFWGLQGVIA